MKPRADDVTAGTAIGRWLHELASVWNRFWFTPDSAETLALIRICGGMMLFYTHLVWTLDLLAFVGPDSWIAPEVARQLARAQGSYAWSFLWHLQSPAVLYAVHGAGLIIFAMLTAGLFTRIVSILAWVWTVAYCHRLVGALFGLDQVNAMVAFTLMIGPSGAAYSVDNWWARRRGRLADLPTTSTMANIAVRLLQCHMCVIYLFGGIGKMRGVTWWQGDAFWFAVANYEYQSIDVSWLAAWPALMALMAHVTVFWETFYCVLVWPKLTRPIMLALAVAVHGGIAMFLGMITFGTAMIIGNMAFVPSAVTRGAVLRMAGLWGRAGQGEPAARSAAPTPRRQRLVSATRHDETSKRL